MILHEHPGRGTARPTRSAAEPEHIRRRQNRGSVMRAACARLRRS